MEFLPTVWEQNLPSLEDVFLTLIDEKGENQYEKI